MSPTLDGTAPGSARIRRQKGGRPSKATRPRLAKLAELLASGCTRAVAAQRVGIDPSTLRRWVREWPALASQLQEAEAKFEVAALAAIVEASFTPGHWQASAWLLERRFPERWGRARLRLRAAEPEGDARVVKVVFGGRHLTLPPSGSEGGTPGAA